MTGFTEARAELITIMDDIYHDPSQFGLDEGQRTCLLGSYGYYSGQFMRGEIDEKEFLESMTSELDQTFEDMGISEDSWQYARLEKVTDNYDAGIEQMKAQGQEIKEPAVGVSCYPGAGAPVIK